MADLNDFFKTISVRLDKYGNVTFPGPFNKGGDVTVKNPHDNRRADDAAKEDNLPVEGIITFALTKDSAPGAKIVGISFPDLEPPGNKSPREVFGEFNNFGLFGEPLIDGNLVVPDCNQVKNGFDDYPYTVHVWDVDGKDHHNDDPKIINDPPPDNP